MASIKISELDELATNLITGDDFFPLDDSGSMTTYRVSVNAINAWLAASGSVNSASFATSASYARSASYALTSSNSITSSHSLSSSYSYSGSYALTSSNAVTASSVSTASFSITASNAISASYSLSSSYALISSNAISSSYAISASYSYSSSYAFSSSNAVTASNAITAAFSLATSANALVFPPLVSGLRIIPSWKTYGIASYSDIPFQQIQVKVDGLVAYDVTATNSKVLQNKNLLIDRLLPVGTAIANTGSLDTGVFSNDQWYNIWVIYNSTTTDTSCIISLSGTEITNSPPTLPSGYDFMARVGCIKDSSGIFWREWHEFGAIRRWMYRSALPSGYGLAGGGLTLSHYFGDVPRSTDIRLKLKKSDANTLAAGFTLGDEFRAQDFISDYGGGETDLQIFGTVASATYLKIWRTRADNSIRSSNATSGNDGNFWGNGSTYFDMLIVSQI